MNTLQYKPPVVHQNPLLGSRPSMILVDEPTLNGDVTRTPHIFGGMSPLTEMASRIAAGIDPRSFLDGRYRNVEDLEGEERAKALAEAIDQAAGFAAGYARRVMAACAAIDAMDMQAQQQGPTPEEGSAEQKNGKHSRIVRP